MRQSCFSCGERGATLVEMALTIGVFLIGLGGSIELIRLGYYSVTYQMLATHAARCGGLGDCSVPIDDTGPHRAQALLRQLAADGGGPGPLARPFGVAIDQADVCAWVMSSSSHMPEPCTNGGDIGNPYNPAQRLFLLQIQRRLPLFFGLGSYTVTAQALGYNEPPST
jgi:hypothetical protein